MNETQETFYLVLLETSGNQNYIFSTNKLKENIGASELTYRVGTQWVLDLVGNINETPELTQWQNSQEFREILLNSEINPQIEDLKKPVEIIIATSGKALLLTKSEENARQIIKNLTSRALKEAPGIDLCGVFVEFEWNNLVEGIKAVYQKFQKVHSQLSSPLTRFLQLPIIEPCKNSGYPASYFDNKRKTVISKISLEKQQQKEESLKRFNKILAIYQPNRKFIEDINKLEKKFDNLDWLAIIHADGNGLGQIFLNFQNYLEKPNDSREYIKKLREFSLALDICTEKAFITAIEQNYPQSTQEIPLIPLIIGGDDLTIVCEGKKAIKLTKDFLENFEKETSQAQKIGENPIEVIPELSAEAFQGVNHLSACAGVAIIKPHFPFSVAYELAEDLIKKAKQVKNYVTQTDEKEKDETQPLPCSAIDFHILYDSSDVKLSSIRGKLKIKDTILHNRPYVVTPLEKLQKADNKDWAKQHHWNVLEKKVKIINAKSKEDIQTKALPSSQIHNLRTALFSGKEVADAQYQLIYHRYQEQGIKKLEDSENSLYRDKLEGYEYTDTKDNITHITSVLDAIDAAEFLTEEEENV
ncbi:MAG: hypothetical protein QNJ37_01360 [Crocosphaera sp.]|nr:hypothetical protein [Crocosphaera sp.]